jgi:hypothetical protein
VAILWSVVPYGLHILQAGSRLGEALCVPVQAMSFVEAYQVGNLRWKRDERTLEFEEGRSWQDNLDSSFTQPSPQMTDGLNVVASDGG